MGRENFKGASFNTADEERKRAESALPKFSGGDRADFFEVKEGVNIFRIAPPHKQGEPAYRA